MYRSWAYILMVVATLAGVVGLLWPSPAVRNIEDIAMPARSAPARAESPAKAKAAAKSPSKPARPDAAPAPPAVVKRMAPQTTATKRAGMAAPQNGLQPNMFGKPAGEGMLGRGDPPAGSAPSRPGSPVTPRPLTPPRPPQPSRDAAAK